VDALYADLRYAVRSLRKSPAFFGLTAAILAIGIGFSISIFSLVDGVLTRPLPYREPQRLVALTTVATKPPFSSNGSLSYNDFLALRAKSRSFSDLAITYRTGWSHVVLTGGDAPEGMQGAFVSPNLFAMAGRSPILGRTFSEEENLRGEHVVVLSAVLWAERFGSSPEAIGKFLEIGHVRWRVIGVMPGDFQMPFLNTELWVPELAHPDWNKWPEDNPRESPRWDVLGRLRPGVSLATAQAEAAAIWAGLRSALPDFHTNDLKVVSLREHFAGRMQRPLLVLFCAVTFFMLIACANVANLMLARASQREHEITLRAALGANRRRILRQLLTEALLLSGIAGLLGAALAVELVPILKSLAPADMPLLSAVQLDVRGLVFDLCVSVLVGLVLGIVPGVRASQKALAASLTAAHGRATESRRARHVKSFIVVAEFTLAMVLLTGAGLFLRSFFAMLGVDLGFQPENVLAAEIAMPGYAGNAAQFYRSVMERIGALPGVKAVGAGSNLFFLDEQRNHALRQVEGRAPEALAIWKPLVWTQVGGDYFRAMGIPLLQGRLFGGADRPDTPPVVIVNETLAKRYWPGQSAVGKRLKGFDPRGKNDDWLTVVGVVRDTRSGGIEKTPFSQIYEPQIQRSGEQLNNLVIRTSRDPEQLAAAVRNVIRRLNSEVTISSVTTLSQVVERQTIQRRFQTWLVTVFSVAALGLATLGIFTLMHYSVSARTAEIGLRMAVGATGKQIIELVLGGSFRLGLAGIIAGGVASLGFGKLISNMLFGVRFYDVTSLGAAAGLLVAASLMGAYLPSFRASRVDPIQALRHE
jgi:predicted permease